MGGAVALPLRNGAGSDAEIFGKLFPGDILLTSQTFDRSEV
jgi:hypothetical protein